MAEFDIDRLEQIVRGEIAAQGEVSGPQTHAEQWRAMARRAAEAGSRSTRTVGRLERMVRRVLHEIRKRRAA